MVSGFRTGRKKQQLTLAVWLGAAAKLARAIWIGSSRALDATTPLQSTQEYYGELIQSKKHDGIRVNYNGEHGKGAFANKDFDEEDLILMDQILVGAPRVGLNKGCRLVQTLAAIVRDTVIKVTRS